ncbi:MAG: hypothetical protein ACTHMJ_11030 [Thermomicrobiales bacterium]
MRPALAAEPGNGVRWRVLLAALPLATGAALTVYILAGWSLPAALAMTIVCAAVVALYGWRRLGPLARIWAARRVRAGVLAGLVATASYDVVRLALVKFGHFTFWPFDIFAVFGRAFLGDGANPIVLRAAGVSYHWANGICFGIAFSLLFGRRGPLAGLLWGLGLETFMVGLYPGWLHIHAIFGEFLSVSLVGHLTYGLVLGTLTRRILGGEQSGVNAGDRARVNT